MQDFLGQVLVTGEASAARRFRVSLEGIEHMDITSASLRGRYSCSVFADRREHLPNAAVVAPVLV